MKTRTFIYYLLAIGLLLPAILKGEEKIQPRFSIMGLGDSITEGGGDKFQSYLFPLWEMLYTAGYSFDFIGPRSGKCRIGSLNHCGFGGKNAEFLDSCIDSIYRSYPADIVLLHTGHNHFDTEKPVDGIIASQESIIRKIRAINPKATVLVAQVIPSGKLPKYSYIPELNKAIARMVKRIHSDQVILVDQANGFDWKKQTIDDKVHPNPLGAKQMAETWFKALQKVLAPSGQKFNPQLITYKKSENYELKLHIFEPQQVKKGSKCPVIVYFFGGGWTLGTPLQFYRECAHYASKGMVAVAADYRIASLNKSSPFDSFEDAKSVIQWLRNHAGDYHIDPEKIVAAGASAGGHLAAATGTIPNTSGEADYCPNLLMLYYPVVDTSERGYGSDEIKKRYLEISPLHNITSQTPPTLFLLGTKDNIIPVRTGNEFKEKLQAQGVECELHLFEGAGHPIFYYAKKVNNDYYKALDICDQFLYKHQYIRK